MFSLFPLCSKNGNRYMVANGLTGKVLAYVGEPVMFANGTSSTMDYHARNDG